MQVFRSFSAAQQAHLDGCAITIGNFDGVHMGHQELLAELNGHAEALPLHNGKQVKSVVITFEPHPRAFLYPKEAPRRLSHLHERLEHLKEAGVDAVVLLHFNHELSSMSAEEFLKKLQQCLKFSHIHVGYDFAFGKGRQGQPEMLRKLGDEFGFTVTEAAAFAMHGAIVSSSRIRSAIEGADFALANTLLNRCYSISGRVGHGDKRGREMGFPTANIQVKDLTHPPVGIYATWAEYDGKHVHSASYLGYRPTFDGRSLMLETHLLDIDEDLYGKRVKVHFVERIREDRAFAGADELARQIREDCEAAKRILDNDSCLTK